MSTSAYSSIQWSSTSNSNSSVITFSKLFFFCFWYSLSLTPLWNIRRSLFQPMCTSNEKIWSHLSKGELPRIIITSTWIRFLTHYQSLYSTRAMTLKIHFYFIFFFAFVSFSIIFFYSSRDYLSTLAHHPYTKFFFPHFFLYSPLKTNYNDLS